MALHQSRMPHLIAPQAVAEQTASRPPAHRRIGSYQTLDGAALAASHLVELGYDADDVLLALGDYVPVDAETLACRVRREAGRSALLGAIAFAVLAALGAMGPSTMVRDVLPAAATGAAGGALVATALAVRANRRAVLPALTAGRPDLQPTRFAVVIDDEVADTAGNDLARWWDPAAPPPAPRQVA